MASQTITANGTYYFNIYRRRNNTTGRNACTFTATGDYDGGTLALYTERDSNAIAVQDGGGAVSFTADNQVNFEIAPSEDCQNPVKLKVVLSGATSPSIIAHLDY